MQANAEIMFIVRSEDNMSGGNEREDTLKQIGTIFQIKPIPKFTRTPFG